MPTASADFDPLLHARSGRRGPWVANAGLLLGTGAIGWGCLVPGGALDANLSLAGLVPLAAGTLALAGSALWWQRRARVGELVSVAVADLAVGDTAAELLRITRTQQPPALAWNRLLDRLAEAGAASNPFGEADAGPSQAGDAAEAAVALDTVPHGLLILGHDGHIGRANSAATRLLQTPRSEILSKRLEQLVDDADLASRAASVAAGLERRGGSLEVAAGREGDSRLRATLRPLRGPRPAGSTGGTRASHVGALVMLEDVTQQRISDRARDLFVAQASHELRAPLQNIQLHAERAIDLGTTPGQEAAGERAECLNHVNDEVIRLSRLIDEVLSVSQIKAGSLGAARDDVAFGPLLERVASEHNAAAHKREQTLVLDAEPGLPVLQGDREKLAMLLHNLLGNAVKYGRRGGATRVKAATGKSTLIVEVADDGPGIPEDEKARVFEPFFRGAREEDGEPAPEGTGLGLPLAAEVAVLHEGSLTVADGPEGVGTVFTLTLPLRPGSARERNQPLPSSAPADTPQREAA